MSAQALLEQLSAVGLDGADDTSVGDVASGQVDVASSQVGDVASSQVDVASSQVEEDGHAIDRGKLRARRRLCWHMRRLKNERVAMRQLRAQALHNLRQGGARTHDHVMMSEVRPNLVPQRMRRSSSNMGRGRGGEMEDAHAGGHRFHAACYCAQHKTGNAVQQVSEYIGLIRAGQLFGNWVHL